MLYRTGKIGRFGIPLLMAIVLALGTLSMAVASLCVWRNPDADIKAFFGGGSYRTVLATVGDKKAKIEKRLGQKLDSDELQLKFWPVTKDGQRVGTVASHLGKGEYGAIEMVVAIVDPPKTPAKVKAVKIQRDRERYRSALRSATFLNQFKGKQANSKLRVGEDIKPAHAQAVRASRVVALSVKKLLVAYEELNIANR